MSIKLFGQSQILRNDEPLQVYREGTDIPRNVDFIDGKPIKRHTFNFEIRGNVQPLGTRDLLIVPEGDRFREQWWVYVRNQKVISEEGIEILEDSLLKTNDQVIRLGIYYQVQGTENWGSYTRARIMRIDVGPTATEN